MPQKSVYSAISLTKRNFLVFETLFCQDYFGFSLYKHSKRLFDRFWISPLIYTLNYYPNNYSKNSNANNPTPSHSPTHSKSVMHAVHHIIRFKIKLPFIKRMRVSKKRLH